MKFILEESPQRIDKQSHHCMKYAISMTCKSIYGIIHASVLITIMHEIPANFYKWQLTVERSVFFSESLWGSGILSSYATFLSIAIFPSVDGLEVCVFVYSCS